MTRSYVASPLNQNSFAIGKKPISIIGSIIQSCFLPQDMLRFDISAPQFEHFILAIMVFVELV